MSGNLLHEVGSCDWKVVLGEAPRQGSRCRLRAIEVKTEAETICKENFRPIIYTPGIQSKRRAPMVMDLESRKRNRRERRAASSNRIG